MLEIHVVGAAVMDKGKVLAAQRSKDMFPPLKWEFAGGKVESGETHSQALQRELYEELGIKIKVNGFVADGESEIGKKRIVLHVYEAEIVEGKPVPSEHSELRWIEVDRLCELDWADADIPACKMLMKRHGSVWCR